MTFHFLGQSKRNFGLFLLKKKNKKSESSNAAVISNSVQCKRNHRLNVLSYDKRENFVPACTKSSLYYKCSLTLQYHIAFLPCVLFALIAEPFWRNECGTNYWKKSVRCWVIPVIQGAMLILNFFESKNQREIDILFPSSFRCKYITILSTFHLTHKITFQVIMLCSLRQRQGYFLQGSVKKKIMRKHLTLQSLPAVAFLLPFGSSDLYNQSH